MQKLNIILAVLGIMATSSSYAQTNIESDVTLQEAIVISDIQDVNFGSLEYQAQSPGGEVMLDTNNQLSLYYTGYNQKGLSQSGSFNMTGIAGELLDISCSSNAMLAKSNNAQNTIALYDISYTLNGLFISCMSSPVSYTSRIQNEFRIGGKINLPSGSQGVVGNFSTSNQGGTPINFSVTYR